MAKGRPSLESLLDRLDEEMALFRRDYGGLPRAVEADEILRDIWIEDTYHSTRIEGNPLSKREVERLLNEGVASGQLSDSLEVEGYSRGAQWVYANAGDHPLSDGVPLAVIRRLHETLVAPSWSLDPPEDGSRPGDLRRTGVSIAGSSVKTTPVIALDGALADWSEATGIAPDGTHEILHVAHLHAWFERIHPFADGNGRVGRLLLSFMLIQRGYPPAVFTSTHRDKYLDALARAEAGSPASLGELTARALETSLNKFLIPRLAGDARLVPLAALAEASEFSGDYLRTLAVSGRLRAVNEGRFWLSSRTWLDEYRASRSPRGRRRPQGDPSGVY